MNFLETERLYFRTWDLTDQKLAWELWGDPDVMAFIDVRGRLNEEQVVEKLQAEIRCQNENKVQYWPMFEKQTYEFVGCCGLKPWTHSARGGLELGFHLVRAKWGKGFAKEAAQGVIQYAFQEKTHLMAGHHPGNSDSKRILMALGFQFVEDVFFKPTGLFHPSYELRKISEGEPEGKA